jgi:hypothetical protein
LPRVLNDFGFNHAAETWGGEPVAPDPARVATEGALQGAVTKHDLLHEALIMSGEAGQLNVGEHALCWIHAKRLAHELETFTGPKRAIQQHMRGLIPIRFEIDTSSRRQGLCPSTVRRSGVCQSFGGLV